MSKRKPPKPIRRTKVATKPKGSLWRGPIEDGITFFIVVQVFGLP